MNNRTRILWALGALALAGLAWWLGSPLVLDRAVDEDFPRTETAFVPDTMTRAEAEERMADAAGLVRASDEPMPADGAPTALRRGEFRDADRIHRGSGTATIYRLATGEHLLRFEGFEVTNGPDLRVLLTPHAGPASRADLDAAGYVELGRLKGNVGNQNYSIPGDLQVEGQGSVVIYCRPFHVVFSVAPLGEVQP